MERLFIKSLSAEWRRMFFLFSDIAFFTARFIELSVLELYSASAKKYNGILQRLSQYFSTIMPPRPAGNLP
jgi:hypothetical protein